MDVLVVTVNVLCWGTVVVVWIGTAIRDAGTRTTGQIRGSPQIGMDALAWSPSSRDRARRTVDPRTIHGGCRMGPRHRRRDPRGVDAVRHLGASRARIVVERRSSRGAGSRPAHGRPVCDHPPPDLHGPARDAAGQHVCLLAALGQWLVLVPAADSPGRRAQDPGRGTVSAPRDALSRRLRAYRSRVPTSPGGAAGRGPIGGDDTKGLTRRSLAHGEQRAARVRFSWSPRR